MGNTSSGTESVTQKQEPWSAAQPYLQNIFGQAQSLYNQGSEYFPGSTVVPFHGDTEAGLQGLREHYSQAPPGYEAATGTVSSIAGGTPSAPGQQLLMSSAGANPFVGDVSAAAGRSNTAGADVLQQFASTNVNPYLDAMFDRAAGKVRDNTNAMFSKAGRFGSTANQDALSDSLGDLATSMYGSAYESDTGRRLAAAEALGAREAGDINRNMQGAITVAGLDESRRGREASAGSTLNQQALQAMPKPFTEEQIRMADPAADIIIPRFMELKQETVDGLFSPSDESYRKRKDAIFKNCDKDGDGVLNEEEYIDLQIQNLDLWKEQYGEAPALTKEEL